MTSPLPVDMVIMAVASAPGTGIIPLGSALPFGGAISFAAAGTADGAKVFYYIQDGSNREHAWGIYSASAQTLTRNTITASVNGVVQNTPINASANSAISSLISGATVAASIQAIPPSPGGMVNKFRNGTFDVWQYGTSIAVPTTGAYTADGWIVVPTGASVNASQAAGRGPTVNSLKVIGATGVTDVIIKQRIESSFAAPLVGGNVTVQARIENNTGAAIIPTLTVRHANASDNWSASTVDVNAVALQSCANGAWTQVSYSYTDPGFSANGIEVAFDFGNNFGSSAKSIQITECDIRVSPLPSSQAIVTPAQQLASPELRPLATELHLCQRYFYSTFGNNIAPGTATPNGLSSVSSANSGLTFPTAMRIAPTLNSWDAAGNANKVSALVTGSPSLSFLGSADSTKTDASSLSIICSADIQAGDTVVVVATEDSAANPAVSVSDGVNTYTQFAAASGFSNTGAGIDLWYCQNCRPVQNPVITGTWSVTQRPTLYAVRMSGMALSGVLDKSSADLNASVTTPALSTQPEIVVAASWGSSTNASISSSGWMTLLAKAAADATHFIILAYRIVNSTAAVTYTTTGWGTGGPHVEGYGTFVGGTIGSFINNITPSGALQLNESATGFVSGLALGALRNQGALFQYTASAEL